MLAENVIIHKADEELLSQNIGRTYEQTEMKPILNYLIDIRPLVISNKIVGIQKYLVEHEKMSASMRLNPSKKQ